MRKGWRRLFVCVMMLEWSGGVYGQADFRRGDVNADGFFDMGDPVYLSTSMFKGGAPLSCRAGSDVNDDGALNLTDIIYSLNYLFTGGLAPKAPFPECGPDPTGDSLDCGSYDQALCGILIRTQNPDYTVIVETPSVVQDEPGATVRFTGMVRLLRAAEPLEGWSLSVVTTDPSLCRIVEATVEGTVGAGVDDTPAGRRDSGFEKTEVTSGTENWGAVSGVALSYTKLVSLDPCSVPYDLLRLTFEATIPQDHTEYVAVGFTNGLQGSGQPVDNILATRTESITFGIYSSQIALTPISRTGFTYQGRLTDQGAPAEGYYDFEFRLYNTSTGGSEMKFVSRPNVEVHEGVFMTKIDFGSDVFDGSPRWLAIAVSPAGAGTFTPLNPRQELTAAPYALATRGILFDNRANTFVGRDAGSSDQTGGGNTFLGYQAGHENGTGNFNTFLGYTSGETNTSGSDNTFLGSYSGSYNSTGLANTFLGHGAGYKNTGGHFNSFLGFEAGYKNTTGSHNLLIGYRSGHENTTGFHNTFIGNWSGDNNILGAENTLLGYAAGYDHREGNSNTFIGYEAGRHNETGLGNVFLGYKAGIDETGSNRLYVANSNTTTPLIYGEFDNEILGVHGRLGIGTIDPEAELHVDGAIRLGGGDRDFEIGEVSTADAEGWASYIDYGGIGIGSTDGTNRQMVMFTDGAHDHNIFTVATSQNNSTTWEADFVIQQNGNVGIGTPSPQERLHVNGSIYSSSGGFKFPDGTVQSTASSNFALPYTETVTLSGHAFEVTNNDTGAFSGAIVGITGSNVGKLGAAANGVYGETNHANGIAVNGLAKNTSGYGNVGGFFTSYGENGTGVWGSATGDDSVGVRGQGKEYDFLADGDGIDYGSSSSIRWKTNVSMILDPLKMVVALRGVYFDWDEEHGGRHDVGMIAEEVGAVLPEIVRYDKNGVDAIGLDYSKVTPLLVEAVKALKSEVDNLRKEQITKEMEIVRLQEALSGLDRLYRENADLLERLIALESMMMESSRQDVRNQK